MKIEDNGFVKVPCRICGSTWLLPPRIAEQFNNEHSYECAYCLRMIRESRNGQIV